MKQAPIIKYQIVEAPNIDTLERKVGELLSEGWKCSGGVAVTMQFTTMRYFQAMTKIIEAYELQLDAPTNEEN